MTPAQDGSYFQRVDAVRDAWGVGGVDQHVGAEAAVDAVAAVLLALAQRLPAGAAVFAGAACRPQPGVADLVADLDAFRIGPELGDFARPFHAEHGADAAGRAMHMALGHAEIGAVEAAGMNLDQHLRALR